MTLAEITYREMNSIIAPTKEMYFDAVDLLIDLGWKFQADPRLDKPIYSHGWWINKDHPTKNKLVGDSKNFYFGAWDTLRLYVK